MGIHDIDPTTGICRRCGEEHPRCVGHKSGNRPCMKWPVTGANVCRLHGGAAGRLQAKIQRERAEMEIARALTSEGIELVEEHPFDALLTEVWRSAAAVSFYGEMIAGLDVPENRDDVIEMVTVRTRTGEEALVPRSRLDVIWGINRDGETASHILIRLWNEERERHAKFAKMAIDAGLAERMVRLAEEQGQLMMRVINAVLDDPALALDEPRKDMARKAAGRHLRGITTGGAA